MNVKKKMQKALTDSSIMPWGKHQGKAMEDVPADYLIWLYDNNEVSGDVKQYIIENMDVLKKQVNEKN